MTTRDERARVNVERLDRACAELDAVITDTQTSVNDWGSFPDLNDYVSSVRTLLSFAYMYTSYMGMGERRTR